MSVDFYVAVPVASWPTAIALEKCLADHSYPVKIKRYPVLDGDRVVANGLLASIDNKDAYLQGKLSIASKLSAEVADINDRLRASGSSERFKLNDVVISFNVVSPTEMRATSYVITALILCFNGLGFEPQGNTSGRSDFAQSLVSGSEALKGL